MFFSSTNLIRTYWEEKETDTISRGVQIYQTLCYLGGSLVAAGLESDLGVSALGDVLLREVPLVLGGHLGADGGAGVVRVLLGGPTQREQAQGHLQQWIQRDSTTMLTKGYS